jgi:hypothetical protein
LTVIALESVDRSCRQAELVVQSLGLEERISVEHADVYSLGCGDRRFDIVCYVGLSYHLWYPQLALDMLSQLCEGHLLASTLASIGTGLVTSNRAASLETRAPGVLYGWEPTEELFTEMLAHAGFRNAQLVSTAPHPGEEPGMVCGNRSYFWGDAPTDPATLPFVGDESFTRKSENLNPPPVDVDLDPLLRLAELESLVSRRNQRVAELELAVKKQNDRIIELTRAVDQRGARTMSLDDAVAKRDSRIDKLDDLIVQRDERITELDSAIVQRDPRAASLETAIAERHQSSGERRFKDG